MRRFPQVCVAAVIVAGMAAGLLAWAQGNDAERKYLIRHQFRDGQKLRYTLSVAGQGEWTPQQGNFKAGEMSTDFMFTLVQKVMRQGGACTFELVGEKLTSSGEGTDGSYSVTASRESCKWELNKLKGKTEDKNPLTNEMTVTIDPVGNMPFSTGLRHIALFFLVHVDQRFWEPLTHAPMREVGVGDEWEVDFPFQLPDSVGRPLDVKAKARVTGWENFGGRRCLAGRLAAELDLKDTTVTLLNGDRAHIQQGNYKADGKVLWDVEQGLLCYAAAQNSLVIISDRPTNRRFAGKARCTLKLLAAQ